MITFNANDRVIVKNVAALGPCPICALYPAIRITTGGNREKKLNQDSRKVIGG